MKTRQARKVTTSIVSTLFIMLISSQASVSLAQLAPNFNSDKHFVATDPYTGYSIGESLYQIKVNEMGHIISNAQKIVENAKVRQTYYSGDSFDPSFYNAVDEKERALTEAVEDLVDKRNKDLIQRMNELPIPNVPESSMQVAGLTKGQIISTAQSIEYTPANDARPEMKKKYDPNGQYGYCFLRAHYYILSSLTRGLDLKSVKKVFLVGTMMPLGFLPFGTWQFHVATAVRGLDGIWYVLDNHLGIDKAYTVAEWYRHFDIYLNTRKDYSILLSDGTEAKASAKALFLFFTDAWKIGASSNAYNKEAFYGTDTNNNAHLDSSEVNYNGIFLDIDNLFLTTRNDGSVVFRTIPFCSKERYKYRSESDPQCNTTHSLEQNAAYENKVKAWKEQYRLELLKAEEDKRNAFSGGG